MARPINCQIQKCQEVGRGVLMGDEFTYSYELGPCNGPVKVINGVCRSCREAGAELGKVYEPSNQDGVWTMTELTDEEIRERLARPPEVRKVKR
jgi:hypothetical protein